MRIVNKLMAIKLANDLAKELNEGTKTGGTWYPHVWSNTGWHYKASLADSEGMNDGLISVHGNPEYNIFHCVISNEHPGAMPMSWSLPEELRGDKTDPIFVYYQQQKYMLHQELLRTQRINTLLSLMGTSI